MLPRMSAALVLSLLALSSCSGGDTPPSTLPTLSPAPSATPTVDAVPSAATAETPDGADAFVRYFFAQMNIAFREARPELIRVLSQPTCDSCKRLADSLDQSRAQGELLTGDSFRLIASAATEVTNHAGTVTVAGDLPARDAVTASGKLIRHYPAQGKFAFDVTLTRNPSGWKVVEMTKVGK